MIDLFKASVYFSIVLIILTPTFSLSKNEGDSVRFRLLNEEIYDRPTKTQVTQFVLASGHLEESILRDKLLNEYRAIVNRGGFIYHSHPSHIFIYIYGSAEQYLSKKDLWVGMLAYGPWNEGAPQVDISKDRLRALYDIPQIRLGLSEKVRKKIYLETATSERKALRIAKNKIPESKIMERLDLQIDLAEQYKKEICEKYSISDDQLMEILEEGATKGWPR